MVSFMSKHVAQHLHAHRPGLRQAVSANFLIRPAPPSASASISVHRVLLSANPAHACFGVQLERLAVPGFSGAEP